MWFKFEVDPVTFWCTHYSVKTFKCIKFRALIIIHLIMNNFNFFFLATIIWSSNPNRCIQMCSNFSPFLKFLYFRPVDITRLIPYTSKVGDCWWRSHLKKLTRSCPSFFSHIKPSQHPWNVVLKGIRPTLYLNNLLLPSASVYITDSFGHF